MSDKKRIGVLGAGKMGLGIAQLFATRGYPVRVIYVYDDKTRYDAREVIRENLQVLVDNDALDGAEIPSILDRIGFVDEPEEIALQISQKNQSTRSASSEPITGTRLT